MKIQELYTKKGQIITQIEILQNQLQLVNKEIVSELSMNQGVEKDG